MAEPKAKPVTKKASSTQAGSTTAAKPKSTKVTATIAAKKTTPKESAAPAVNKSAAAAPNKKIPVKKTTPAKKTTAKLTPEQRYLMVQTAAYFIAERNGFGGRATEHWAAAEIEIASKLS